MDAARSCNSRKIASRAICCRTSLTRDKSLPRKDLTLFMQKITIFLRILSKSVDEMIC
jgi:hypothetical protein